LLEIGLVAGFISWIWEEHVLTKKKIMKVKKKGKNHIFVPTFSGDSHFGP